MNHSAPREIFLSIVTISFNQAQYLGALLNSVCPQVSDDIEFIVVDPGSTDGSRELLMDRRDCITHLVLEPDEGPADGLNRGLALARGRIGYFVNSDDLMMPNAVASLRRLWSQHHDADILLGNAWMIDAEDRPLRELRATRQTGIADFLGDRAVLVQQGMSFRMAAFRKAGGFNAANRTCWDYELLCQMLAQGARAVRVRERLGAFRMSGNNISSGVGGAAHMRGFQDDKARITRELGGQVASHGRVRRAHARTFKLLRNVPQLLGATADIAFPCLLARRWESDLSQ